MKKEPMIYAVAGIIFGFVLGYMAAGAGGGPRPVSAPSTFPPSSGVAGAGLAGGGAPAGRPAAAPLDTNEVQALESLANRDKTNAQSRIELGNVYMDHARYDDAVRWYREALALVPNNADVRVDLGACLVGLQRFDEAVTEFDQALKVQPGHKKAMFNKGVAYLNAGRPKDAVTAWEELLARYPDDPQFQSLRQQVQDLKARGSAP